MEDTDGNMPLRNLNEERENERKLREAKQDKRRKTIERNQNIKGRNIDSLINSNFSSSENKKEKNSKKKSNREDPLESRLREAKKIAKERNLKEMSKRSKKIGRTSTRIMKKELAKNRDKVFMILLIIAVIVDLIDVLDLGTFTTILNICVYILVIMTAFLLFVMKSGNKFNIFYILKGQLWKYAIMPLLECIPFLGFLPFWTLTVLMMWMRARFMIKKINQQPKFEEAEATA